MASVTRSNRRAEGLHHPHHAHHAHHHLNPHGGHGHHHPLTRAARPPVELYASSNGGGGGGRGRQKRALEPADRDIDALKPKKTRIAVEIIARQQPPPMQGVGTNVQPPPIPRLPTIVPAPTLPLPNYNTTTTKTALGTIIVAPLPRQSSIKLPPPAATAHHFASPHPPFDASGPQPTHEEPNLTKHQAKVINGIKAELDRLQPQPVVTREQGRKLRSQEATRFKSDLSAYFPDYDEVIGNDPKEQHLLNLETPIVVFDSNPRPITPEAPRGVIKVQQQTISNLELPVRGYGDSLFTDVFDSQRIDFRFLETQQNGKKVEDPLPDSLFEPSHKRAERLERSIRNTEKGRAQHEKDQIIRLLEALQGHDWLRVMGVSGVTETKKKSFEPARVHFIKGCQGILDKFRAWNLEEKRRKLQKERALLAEQQAALGQGQHGEYKREPKSEIEDSADDGSEETDFEHMSKDMDRDAVHVIEDSEEVVTSQSDTSDASPAKQLRQEAMARSQLASAGSKRPKAPARPTVSKPEPPRVFTSFFSKRYERDTALNRTRRTGRKVLAWGHPVPDMDEADFVLPEEYRDEELLKSRARKKRRDKRHSRA